VQQLSRLDSGFLPDVSDPDFVPIARSWLVLVFSVERLPPSGLATSWSQDRETLPVDASAPLSIPLPSAAARARLISGQTPSCILFKDIFGVTCGQA